MSKEKTTQEKAAKKGSLPENFKVMLRQNDGTMFEFIRTLITAGYSVEVPDHNISLINGSAFVTVQGKAAKVVYSFIDYRNCEYEEVEASAIKPQPQLFTPGQKILVPVVAYESHTIWTVKLFTSYGFMAVVEDDKKYVRQVVYSDGTTYRDALPLDGNESKTGYPLTDDELDKYSWI